MHPPGFVKIPLPIKILHFIVRRGYFSEKLVGVGIFIIYQINNEGYN